MDILYQDDVYIRLVIALLVGAVLGLERSYRARPAGFRTHALVCVTSALLMIATLGSDRWDFEGTGVSMDPTRVIQGIMTGIGFLGAGTIIKAGINVRGLTTAASIWATAAVGVLLGVGMTTLAVAASAIVLATLSLFRWIEDRIPVQIHIRIDVGFRAESAASEVELRALARKSGVEVLTVTPSLDRDADRRDYRLTVAAKGEHRLQTLCAQLQGMPQLVRFRCALGS